jgi:hypothetical protein
MPETCALPPVPACHHGCTATAAIIKPGNLLSRSDRCNMLSWKVYKTLLTTLASQDLRFLGLEWLKPAACETQGEQPAGYTGFSAAT